jgi:hypothetical protein
MGAMRFALAVLIVVLFLGLGVHFAVQGQTALRWMCLAAAVITPWLLGMEFGRTSDPPDTGQ